MHAAVIAALGLAASAFAAPAKADRSARRALARQGRTIQRATPGGKISPDTKNNDQSTNWSGAVLEGKNWKTVSATINIPTPKAPSGGSRSTEYSASAWVGIDGDSCQTALWQTGVDFNIQGGQISYDAWWEWIPDSANFFSSSQISFSPGDQVALTVTATSKTKGTATIQNLSSGQKVSKTTTGPASLCLTDAEWIVEDFEEGGSLVPLVNWGTVTFSNATATTSSGSSSGPSGADIIDLIDDNGNVLTHTTVTSNSVSDSYTAN